MLVFVIRKVFEKESDTLLQKKMREAFSLKKKLSRRQEYKKLVTQYGDANMSSSLTCVDTVPHTVSPESNKPELQPREFCESDWELL